MTGTWAIDTLDARGGLAFASYRTFSLKDEGDRLREAPCVWIAPPYFEPEPVVSRAVAWSADRGAFQLGLFHDGEEVRFETIEAVIEFVRRTYLRSGGGDGLEGGGTPLPVPPSPDEGPDLRPPTFREDPDERPEFEGMPLGFPRGGGGAEGAVDVLRLLKDFEAAAVTQKGPVAGAPMRWTGQDADQLSTVPDRPRVGVLQRAQDQLGWASLILIRELLLRLPKASRPEERLAWERSALTLGRIMTEFGTWDWLLLGPYRSELQNWVDVLSIRWEKAGLYEAYLGQYSHMHYPYNILFFYSRLFGVAAWRFVRQYSGERWDYYLPEFGASTHNPRASIDPVEDLSRLPLPSALARCVRQEKHDNLSVFQLLGAASGAPLCLRDDGTHGRDAFAVLLFAAGWLLQSKEAQPPRAFEAGFDPMSDLEAARISDLVGRAWAWLGQSMPRLAFPYEIETTIAQASSLRYGGAANSGLSDPSPGGSPPRGDAAVVDDASVEEGPRTATAFDAINDREEEKKNDNRGNAQNREPPFLSA